MPYVHIDTDEMLSELDDDEIVEELKARGYDVSDRGERLDKREMDNLYKEFLGPEDKFRAYVKKLLIDNGYHP